VITCVLELCAGVAAAFKDVFVTFHVQQGRHSATVIGYTSVQEITESTRKDKVMEQFDTDHNHCLSRPRCCCLDTR